MNIRYTIMNRFAILTLVLSLGACVQEAREDVAATADDDSAAVAFPATNRPEVMGRQAAVSSDHALATAAGYEVLRRGGNAMDAAVTMAAVLSVVRPHMNGVGGDAIALIYDARTHAVTAMNASGAAGQLASPAFFQARDSAASVPLYGAQTVTVPGAVAGWEEALRRYGTIPLGEALAPAIELAEHGFPVTQQLRREFLDWAEPLNEAGRLLYLPEGSPPPAGSLLRQRALAGTLRRIAEDGAAVVYTGDVGHKLAVFIEAEGGHLRAVDFAAHRTEWMEPIMTEYAGYRVLAVPPNTQGITLLQQMRIAEVALPQDASFNSVDYLHRMVAAKQLAFADRDAWIADPRFTRPPVGELLSIEYARERAARIGERALTGTKTGLTLQPSATPLDTHGNGDTVYLTAIDQWGNAVSWIQSLFHGFGSGLFEPETGVVLHNRGNQYTLEPGHPQVVAPGKRPFHTLTPHMAFRGDRLAMTFGSPGGDGQTQTLLQVFHNIVRFGMPPQEAVEAPRYRSDGEGTLLLEDRISAPVRSGLAKLGYEVRTMTGWNTAFGGAQVIWIDSISGARVVGSDPRREAYGLAY